MIPLVAIVRIRPAGHRGFHLWAPLFLLWLLLLPLLILALPFFVVGCWVGRLNPFSVFAGLAGVLCAAPGTCIEVQAPGTEVLVRIV